MPHFSRLKSRISRTVAQKTRTQHAYRLGVARLRAVCSTLHSGAAAVSHPNGVASSGKGIGKGIGKGKGIGIGIGKGIGKGKGKGKG
eukprot:SAG31_NODE_8165_length_1505_cov_551.359175_1_plen_86_part_10